MVVMARKVIPKWVEPEPKRCAAPESRGQRCSESSQRPGKLMTGFARCTRTVR